MWSSKRTKMTELSWNKDKAPRVNARQIYGSNAEFITPDEYYCIPFMGSWKQQLNEKFSGKTKTSMSEMYLIPSLTKKLPESEVFEYYLFDLPSFRQGIQLWKLNWANEKNIPITLSETLKYIIMKNMKEIFPNYTRVLAFS